MTGGEDAYFISGENWLGVADGASQWSMEGKSSLLDRWENHGSLFCLLIYVACLTQTGTCNLPEKLKVPNLKDQVTRNFIVAVYFYFRN